MRGHWFPRAPWRRKIILKSDGCYGVAAVAGHNSIGLFGRWGARRPVSLSVWCPGAYLSGTDFVPS